MIDGINVTTGAQRGFYELTNEENAVGAKKNNFLMGDDRIQSSECTSTP